MAAHAAIAKDRPTNQPTGNHRTRSFFHGFFMVLFIAVTCLALGAYSIVRWSEHQVLTTDNWVAFVSPLPKQPVVYTALGSYVSAQVFQAASVQQEIANALPPRAAFLASPLTDQLRNSRPRSRSESCRAMLSKASGPPPIAWL